MSEHGMITSLMKPFFKKGAAASFRLPDVLGEAANILCLDAGDLSEVLFQLPLVTALRRRHPDARVDFLLPERHAPLLVPGGLARECIVYKDGQLNPWRPAFGQLLRKLGTVSYDLAVVMSFSPQPRFELAALASGAALRLGTAHDGAWPGVNFEVRATPDDPSYLGDRLPRLAPFFGLTPDDLRAPWPLPVERQRQAAQQVHFHKPNPDMMLIGVDPGIGKSGNAVTLENLQYLVRQLTSRLVCQVLPLGDNEDGDRRVRFEQQLSQVPIGLRRDTLLDQILLLSQCDLFVAGNTDFFHFAVNLGVPAIGLFAGAEAACWIPADRPRVRVLPVTSGARLEVEPLIAAIEEVTGGRTTTPSTVIAPSAESDDASAAGDD